MMLIDACTDYSTVKLVATLREFNAVGAGGGCSHSEFELDIGTDDIKITTDPRGQYEITVEKPVYLEFVLVSVLGYAYIPFGIAFTEKRIVAQPSKSDTFGHMAFPQRINIDDKRGKSVLRVLDVVPYHTDFDFYLFIQRSDGLVSVIDPKIRNRPNKNNVVSGSHPGSDIDPLG